LRRCVREPRTDGAAGADEPVVRHRRDDVGPPLTLTLALTLTLILTLALTLTLTLTTLTLTRSGLHYDAFDNLLLLLRGRKRACSPEP